MGNASSEPEAPSRAEASALQRHAAARTDQPLRNHQGECCTCARSVVFVGCDVMQELHAFPVFTTTLTLVLHNYRSSGGTTFPGPMCSNPTGAHTGVNVIPPPDIPSR